MGDKTPFTVRFWGVRGSIACSGPRTARYGGNTSSLEVRCGERLLLFDAGTGIRYLGKTLDGARIDGDIYFTHTHFDHVCGLPFFRPLFQPQNKFRLWAGHLSGAMTLKRVLAEFMMSPLFPVPPEVFRSTLEKFDGYYPRRNGKVEQTAGPKLAHFERIEWTVMQDTATAAAALQRGEIDWLQTPNNDLSPTLKGNRNIVVRTILPTGLIAYMRFNHLVPPFDSPAMRRALLGAI